jgi:hypothetical protein
MVLDRCGATAGAGPDTLHDKVLADMGFGDD